MTTTENNVAAQAGDELMPGIEYEIELLPCVCPGIVPQLKTAYEAGHRHALRAAGEYVRQRLTAQVSPRATTAVTEALQVCVKALEFRKERSANDEFALNLARIALAEAPRATADVEREKLPHGHRDDFHLIANARALAMEPIHRIKSMPNWVLVKELFATGSTSAHEICAKAGIDPDGYGVPRATTKPGA